MLTPIRIQTPVPMYAVDATSCVPELAVVRLGGREGNEASRNDHAGHGANSVFGRHHAVPFGARSISISATTKLRRGGSMEVASDGSRNRGNPGSPHLPSIVSYDG